MDPNGDERGGLTAPRLHCGSCGTALPPNSKFCNECGLPVTQRMRSAEYKQVTVLFADVVHSMDIAATVGAERLREIMTELVTRSSAAVQRYGGTVDKFTGDGIMAVFGAPAALEDHALRACLASLGIQDEVTRLAVDVDRRDGVDLRLRVGLNSGQVIAGEIGSGVLGYTAVGEQVGMAQRMEAVAPPGGVMLSGSTARLVKGTAVLGDPELVHTKDSDRPVWAQRLLGVSEFRRTVEHAESTLVGRRWEMSVIKGLLERTVDGEGAAVGVVGSPGIGKSRLVRDVAAMAAARGVDVFSAYCESHTSDIAFHVVAQLLRAANGVADLDGPAARAQVRAWVPDAEAEDSLLFDDLVGIADPDVALPKIDPDARRRRLTALINTASLARANPAVYVVEDAHWIDEVSESMLADLFTVLAGTPSLVLVTYRPEYRGALSRAGGAQAIVLDPLTDPETTALASHLLGADPSVDGLSDLIAGRAAGNPFFVEEMVRDLAERGVLGGSRGAYVSTAEVADISVPATLQATISARIDRLDPRAKRTLSAAAVIGSRFSRGLLETLGVDPVVEDLVSVELIDQIRAGPQAEYVFHHPLIRTVAYESQLKSDRAELHQRIGAAIESWNPTAADENAALIAEHVNSAGDLHAAYGWHMRASAWATNRDINAARLSFERAQAIADALPADDPARASMRIAPRAMLCAIAWRVHLNVAGTRFDEMRRLCAAAGDKTSLAIAMTGLIVDHSYQARVREASLLASEHMALIESLDNPILTVLLSSAPIHAQMISSEWSDVLGWSQRVIDLATGDFGEGIVMSGSPIGNPWALAFASRGVARFCLGHPGWRDDLGHGVALARSADPLSYALVVTMVYGVGIPCGSLRPDDTAILEIEDALRIAERSGDDVAVDYARQTLGMALVHRHTPAEQDRGRSILTEASDAFRHRKYNLAELPIVNVYLAREWARCGDRDGALPLIRAAIDDLDHQGRLPGWGVQATYALVETLLGREADGDVSEAVAAIERLATSLHDNGLPVRDIWLLRLRALLARAHRDDAGYYDYRDRYRAMATSLGFEGHMDWAEAMP